MPISLLVAGNDTEQRGIKMIKLNTPIATKDGLMTAIKTHKNGFEIFVLILQTGTENKIIGSAYSERKILNLGYKNMNGVSEY